MKTDFQNELELLRWFNDLANEALDAENDSDYEVNRNQMKVFKKVVDYFSALIQPEYGEKIEYKVRSPKWQSGYITVTMQMIDFTGEHDGIVEFCNALSESISLGIFPLKNGKHFVIDMVIPDLYVKKGKKNP